jgi:DNA-binding response OmpR family regulator
MIEARAMPFCPCCGHNLAAEAVIAIGQLRVDPRGDATWGGGTIGLTSAEHIILASIAGAKGAIVAKAVLQERIGYEGDGNVIDVFLTKMRRKLRAAGAPPALIANVRDRGWRLDLSLLAANDALEEGADQCR